MIIKVIQDMIKSQIYELEYQDTLGNYQCNHDLIDVDIAIRDHIVIRGKITALCLLSERIKTLEESN